MKNPIGKVFKEVAFIALLCSGLSFADAIPTSAVAQGGAQIRDLQLREIRDIMRGGRGGYIDIGIDYLPLPSQTPLASEFGEHKGFAFRQHAAGFGSGEVAKNNHLGMLLWFERSGWDGEDFALFPKYSDFSLARSVTTWGLVYTNTTIDVTVAGGMQHQNVEYVGDVYPNENDTLLYSWGEVRYGHVSVQGSFHRKDWRNVRISLDLESREIYGGRKSGVFTYLPNFDVSLYNGGTEDDSVRVFWEQNLFNQVLYAELAYDFPSKEFYSAALKFYPDPSRMVAFEATCLRRNVRHGAKDLLWGGGIRLPFLRVAYNSAYDYETLFHAKGTWIVELQLNLATVDGLLFSRGGTKSAPLETIKKSEKKGNFKKEDGGFLLDADGKKSLEASGIRFEKAPAEGGEK